MPFESQPAHFPPPPPGFQATGLALRAGGLRLVHGGQGPPLIMVHGLGGSSEDFFNLAPLMATRHTVLIPDLPGFGGSAKPDQAPYTMNWFLEVLQEMCARLGLDRAAWLGHSMGGLLTLLLAARLPRLTERVIAVCPAGGHRRPRLLWRLLQALLVGRDHRLRVRWPYPLLFYVPLVVFAEWSPRSRDFSRRFIRRWQGPQGPALERALVRAALSLFQSPIWAEVGRIQCPVLMVTGRRDLVIPGGHTRRLAACLPPDRRVLELPCGHMAPYTHAGPISRAALDFCRRGG